jgi:hypothetical protein
MSTLMTSATCLVQGNARRRRIAHRILFHAIDEVIRPLDPSHAFHQEPLSIKKLLKGDGCWGTSKMILGWLIDTVKQTLELPPHRYEWLCAIFDDLWGRKRVSLKQRQQTLGRTPQHGAGYSGRSWWPIQHPSNGH